MQTAISRKNFLKKTGLLLCVPALFSLSTACDNNSIASLSKTEKFDALLAKKTFVIKKLAKHENSNEIFMVPKDVMFERKVDLPLDHVLRKTMVNGKAYFQIVEVKLIESLSTHSLIAGINLEDELVYSPEALLNEMTEEDRVETKKRLIKIQHYQGGE